MRKKFGKGTGSASAAKTNQSISIKLCMNIVNKLNICRLIGESISSKYYGFQFKFLKN